MFLIDTSAWIFALKKNYHPMVKDRIDRILLESDVAINGIITLELLGGARTEKEYIRLQNRLDALYYIEADRALWDRSAHLAFDMQRNGFTIPSTDIFIAAAAIQEKAILLHADAHFNIIAEHSSLKIESLTLS